MPTDSYLIALLLTIVIEVFVALAFGQQSRKEVLSVILLNLITQPVLSYILLINSYFSLVPVSTQLVVFAEIGVILVEWRLLVYTLLRNPKRLFVLSLVMNSASYVIGFLLFR